MVLDESYQVFLLKALLYYHSFFFYHIITLGTLVIYGLQLSAIPL